MVHKATDHVTNLCGFFRFKIVNIIPTVIISRLKKEIAFIV